MVAEVVSNLKSKWPKLTSNEETQFKCPKCSFEATTKFCLDKHVNGHNDCEQCGKVFVGGNGKRDLANHLKTHQVKIKDTKSVCEFCDKDYKTAWKLKRHQITCKQKKQ